MPFYRSPVISGEKAGERARPFHKMERMKINWAAVLVFLLYAAMGYALYRGFLWAGASRPMAQTVGVLYTLFFAWRTFWRR